MWGVGRNRSVPEMRHAVDMLTTPLCELFGIIHPVVLGGMGLGTNPDLVAAVCNAGGLGIQGCGGRLPAASSDVAAGSLSPVITSTGQSISCRSGSAQRAGPALAANAARLGGGLQAFENAAAYASELAPHDQTVRH